MDNEYYLNFLDSAEQSIKNGNSQKPGLSLPADDMSQFIDRKGASERIAYFLKRSLDYLDEELNKFENNFSGKFNSIFWASDYNDVFANLKKIFKAQKAKTVRLPNINMSTIFKELGMKYFLRDEKIQLSDDGDIQFFVADMLLPDAGSILLLNQSNNSFEKLTNNKTNIFFTTIDRVLCNTGMAEIYQQMASINSGMVQQDMVIFKGSPNCGNYLFVVDNQRSSLLKEKNLRQSLSCTHCKRCNTVCPVIQTIGEEPYNNVFTGPIANITLPFLETMESYKHVVYACTLCGKCEEVCPVALPIRNMIVEERYQLFSGELIDKNQRVFMSRMRKFLTNRKKMNTSELVKRVALHNNISSDIKKNRKLPSFSRESFNKKQTHKGNARQESGK